MANFVMSEGFKDAVLELIAEHSRQQNPVPRRRPFINEGTWQEVIFLGKTDASHDKGNTGTISIYGKAGDAIGSETDTGDNLEGVYNRFANVGSGKWVLVLPSVGGNGYELIAAEC